MAKAFCQLLAVLTTIVSCQLLVIIIFFCHLSVVSYHDLNPLLMLMLAAIVNLFL